MQTKDETLFSYTAFAFSIFAIAFCNWKNEGYARANHNRHNIAEARISGAMERVQHLHNDMVGLSQFLLDKGDKTLKEIGHEADRQQKVNERIFTELDALVKKTASVHQELADSISSTSADYEKRVLTESARVTSLDQKITDAINRFTPNNDLLISKAVYPTVMVIASTGTGSGTIISTDEKAGKYFAYILTAHHVIANDVIGIEGEPVSKLVSCTVYRAPGVTEKVYGKVIAYSAKEDLAIIKLESVAEFKYKASLYFGEDYPFLSRVVACGFPLGDGPVVTRGEFMFIKKEPTGLMQSYATAPITFGNSGGGLYSDETSELVGVVVAVRAHAFTVVAHMGLSVPTSTVIKFLKEKKLQKLLEN